MNIRYGRVPAVTRTALSCAAIAIALAGCQKRHETATPAEASAPPAPGVALGAAPPPGGADPLADAKSPAAPTPAETQVQEDIQDNARAAGLAVQLAAHPDWLARQKALCGPGDATLQARYAARQGAPDQDLRDFRIACLAKDAVERGQAGQGPDTAGGSGPGVKNTKSL